MLAMDNRGKFSTCFKFSIYVNLFIQMVSYVAGNCRMNLQFPDVEPPLFLSPAASELFSTTLIEAQDKPFFLYPTSSGKKSQTIDIHDFQAISCPGNRNKFVERSGAFSNFDVLSFCSRRVRATDIECKSRPKGYVLHTTSPCSGEEVGTLRVIGWKISEDLFLPQITICFDDKMERTLYTKHIIYGHFLEKRIPSPGRPSFKSEKFYTNDIGNLFKQKSQQKMFAKFLTNEMKILGSRNLFFARGHLAPDADFILPAEQDATYFYANAAPQFQKFNNGNWKVLEEAIRQLAISRDDSLTIYTGTLQILNLEDDHGNILEVFLDPDNSLYPVPKMLWKLIHDKRRNEAIAVLGLNFVLNHRDKLNEFFNLCVSVCNSLSWGQWDNANDWTRGPLICCTYNQFKKILPKFKLLRNVQLLIGN